MARGSGFAYLLIEVSHQLICEIQAERWKSDGIYENNYERFIKIKFSKIGEDFEGRFGLW